MSINDKILKLIIKKIWIVFSLIGVFLLFSSCIQNIEINETRPIDNVEIVINKLSSKSIFILLNSNSVDPVLDILSLITSDVIGLFCESSGTTLDVYV